MLNKILIANRGEIASRIIKTARRLNIETVAVYSTAECDSPHVLLADEAYCIGEPPAIDSYLNIDAIIHAAKISKAQAIHPGYGFLSENPLFAQACCDANLIFIGPSVPAMQTMASKQLAKRLLEKTGVPLTPGYHGKNQTDEQLLKEAEKIGFPVLLKAANGGGGKGMRAVFAAHEFAEALAGARREATAYFANDTMLIEKLVSNPRHIEIQIMADNHGNIVHLFERDCSIQRRHQKIIEEAPAPNLSTTLRKALADAAITVARTIDYRGAGTVEFLVSDEQFYFMEMNTRLQVEHPVTEMITGFDLVEWQFLIAANESLPVTQDNIHQQGHAIECRIYAEDPRHEFMPSVGQLHFLNEPFGEGIRIDSGVVSSSNITRFYDPMIAKLIAWGEDRTQALKRLQIALKHYHIGGVKTNIPFLQAIIEHPHFIQDTFSTDFLAQETIVMPLPDKKWACFMAASVDYLNAQTHGDALYKDTFAWRMHQTAMWQASYLIQEERFDVTVTPINLNQAILKIGLDEHTFLISAKDNELHLDDGQQRRSSLFEQRLNGIVFYTPHGPITVDRFYWQTRDTAHQGSDRSLNAPMPATIVAILKQVGDSVKMGEGLIVLEAMKMEHTIHAPFDGLLEDIFFDKGIQVPEGAQLVALKKIEKEVS